MKTKRSAFGFTLVELMIVLGIIGIAISIAVFAFKGRASHFRLRSSTRETLEMMKLAQAAAIRANLPYRLVIDTTGTYSFQMDATGAGAWGSPSGTDGRLAIGQTLESGILFTGATSANCASFVNCLTAVTFRSDGTMNGNGVLGFTDAKETFRVEWKIGGSIRVR